MAVPTPVMSVVIPTFERAHCVGDAIESARSGGRSDREVVVVDDASTDDTAERVCSFGDGVRYLRLPENRGVSAARNAGIRAARGRYVAFLDSDDVWREGKLDRQVREMEKTPDLVAHATNVRLQLDGGRDADLFGLRGAGALASAPRRLDRPLPHVLKSCFLLQGLLVRRDACLAAGPFREEMRIYEDFDFLTRLSLVGPWATDPEPYATVRRRDGDEGCLSRLRVREPLCSLANFVATYRHLLGRPELDGRERAIVRRRLADRLYDAAEAVAAAGRRHEVRRFAAASARAGGVRAFARALPAVVLGARGLPLLRPLRATDPGLRRSGGAA